MLLFRGREAHSRSLTKAISWRVLGSIDTFLLSLLFTASVKAAGAIAGTEVVTKMALYYLHERAWSRISWGMHKGAPDGGAPAQEESNSPDHG